METVLTHAVFQRPSGLMDAILASPAIKGSATFVVGHGAVGYSIALFSLWTVYLFFVCIYRLTLHPLASFPGPFLAKISPLYYAWAYGTGRGGPAISEAHRKYGPVVRIAPNDLSFGTPSSYRDIYGKAPPGQPVFVKADFYKQICLGFHNPGMASETDNDRAVEHRKMLSPLFSPKAIRSYEQLLLVSLETFLAQCKKIGSTPEGINISEWFHRLLYDVTADLAYGETGGAVDDPGSSYWLSLVNDNINIATYIEIADRFTVLKFLVKRIMVPLTSIIAREKHVKWSMDTTRRRMENIEKRNRPDMLTPLMEEADIKGVDLDQITSHLSQIILAGGGATAVVVTGILYSMMKHPEMIQKLREEIDPLFETSDQIVSPALGDCCYLAACIKEGLRQMPAGPSGLPRCSPGRYVDDYWIPKGTGLFTHAWTLTRDPKYFKDPYKFDPQRWIDKDNTDLKEASQPFIVGPRQCIGQALAIDQLRVIIARVFYVFDLEMVNPPDDWVKECKTYLTWHTAPLMVRFKPRPGAECDPFFVRTANF